jgi:MoaA/NifB/PqqE/SkfB family radical SAM enzyme
MSSLKKLVYDNKQDDYLMHGLHFLWLEITPYCPLRCKHCYAESLPTLYTPKVVDWMNVLRQASDLGCKNVQFIGGEPMASPNFLKYLSYAHELSYDFIEVFSNLVLLRDKILNELVKYHVNIATSFYSWDPSVHDKITGVPGSQKKTVEGIKKVLSAGLPIRVGIVTMDDNSAQINDTIDYLVSLGVKRDHIGTDIVRPVGRGKDLTPQKSLHETLCGFCCRGRLAVSWDGSVYPCVFARAVNLGNINTVSLKDIVSSNALKEFREESHEHRLKKYGSSTKCDPDCYPNASCQPEVCCPNTVGCDPTR